jgi:hypothetical protein
MPRQRRPTSKAAVVAGGLLVCLASLGLPTALAATSCPYGNGVYTIVGSGTYNGQSTRVVGVTGEFRKQSVSGVDLVLFQHL